MAAGLGFKDFVTGEVLTAADVDGYLMQGIWVFDDAAARDAAVTSPQEGNACYLKDTNEVLTYSGSVWVAVGGGSPLTTKGDLYTFSTVDARLAVGANDTVLTADSSEATGLKWATPTAVSSGATLISRTSFTTSAAVTIDSLFSDTYEDYIVNMQTIGSANGLALRVQGRYSTTTDTGSTYYTGFCGVTDISSTLQVMRSAAATYWYLGDVATGADFSIGNFTFYRPTTSGQIQFTGQIVDRNTGYLLSGAALNTVSRAWTGLYIFPSSGTITGQISVYGLAKS
jgi:hypothetical protein